MNSKTKNILVGLDLSELDDKLIQYVSNLSKELKTENVYFIHNIKKYQISDIFSEKLSEINLEEVIGDKLKEKVEKLFTGTANYEVFISEDPSTESLISYIATKYQIGLTILGNKNSKQGIGTVTGKLLRMLKSDILLIPEDASLPIKKLMATTDFSKNSQKAISLANDLAQSKNASLSCLNIYKVPQVYFPYLNIESAQAKLEKHTDKQFDKLFKRMNLTGIQREMRKAGGASLGERIREVAEKNDVDILFVSDKGHSGIVSLLVGSVTEELFTHDLHVPLWVVK